MLTLLSARHDLRGKLRRYQHDRFGIITTVTVSSTLGVQIIRIYRQRQDAQANANNAPPGAGRIDDTRLAAGSTKCPMADQRTAITATENFRSDAAVCPQCNTRAPSAVGLLCLDCLLVEIMQSRAP
jgi:hypothetical protein